MLTRMLELPVPAELVAFSLKRYGSPAKRTPGANTRLKVLVGERRLAAVSPIDCVEVEFSQSQASVKGAELLAEATRVTVPRILTGWKPFT